MAQLKSPSPESTRTNDFAVIAATRDIVVVVPLVSPTNRLTIVGLLKQSRFDQEPWEMTANPGTQTVPSWFIKAHLVMPHNG